MEEDPSAFAYDEVIDDIKQKAIVPKLQDRQDRKVNNTNNAKINFVFFFNVEFVVVIAAKICAAFDEEGGAETEGA